MTRNMIADLPQFHPQRALGLDETGLPRGLIYELVLKRVFLEGTTTLSRLIDETKLDYVVVDDAFRSMQRDQLLDVKGMMGHDYEFRLTVKGVHAAETAFRKSQYAGAAPVPLANYCQAVREQAFHPQVTKEVLIESLGDLVITEQTILDLGAAIMTGGALFMYGPTGNGKSSIAERLHRIFHDLVYIPYAVEVSAHTLSVFDPHVHHAAEPQPPGIDPRWVLCRRPFLIVGGEMTAGMLEPNFDPSTRIGVAPIQMKANNGILVIDDFGRQPISPQELLNRWIVPLDRRVDYLSFGQAMKFEIPFELMVVFATNLDPGQLAEEAFLRRVKNKIKIDAVSPEVFTSILRRQCEARGVGFDPEMADYACQRCCEHTGGDLRACYPRDLMDLVCGVAAFERRHPMLSREEVDRAFNLYFTR